MAPPFFHPFSRCYCCHRERGEQFESNEKGIEIQYRGMRKLWLVSMGVCWLFLFSLLLSAGRGGDVLSSVRWTHSRNPEVASRRPRPSATRHKFCARRWCLPPSSNYEDGQGMYRSNGYNRNQRYSRPQIGQGYGGNHDPMHDQYIADEAWSEYEEFEQESAATPYNYSNLDSKQLHRFKRSGSSEFDSKSIRRIILPAIGASVLGMLLFPVISIAIRSFLDMGEVYVLSNDQSQFVQNFITVNGLLFSILTGNAFYFLYQQQEALFYALFAEVSEAKSLLEQVTFVCQGRAFYRTVLEKIAKYVKDDLRRIDYPPAVLLSSKPQDDPLESILYLTSVGVPSIVYETVRSLRQARAQRLGATQRKLPKLQFILLYVLSFIELIAFPFLGAGTSAAHQGSNILSLEGFLFGLLCGGIMLTLQVIHELWSPMGGVYQVDNVLGQMVMGLEEELDQRFQGVRMSETQLPSPPPSFGDRTMPDDDGSSGSDGTRRRPTASESRMTARFNSPEASISARAPPPSAPSGYLGDDTSYAARNEERRSSTLSSSTQSPLLRRSSNPSPSLPMPSYSLPQSQRDGQTVNPSARDTALSSVTEPELKFYRQLPPPPMSPRENPATTRTKTQQQPSKISRARKFLSKLFGPSS